MSTACCEQVRKAELLSFLVIKSKKVMDVCASTHKTRRNRTVLKGLKNSVLIYGLLRVLKVFCHACYLFFNGKAELQSCKVLESRSDVPGCC